MDIKTCKVCGRELPADSDHWYLNKQGKPHGAVCMECLKRQQAGRRKEKQEQAAGIIDGGQEAALAAGEITSEPSAPTVPREAVKTINAIQEALAGALREQLTAEMVSLGVDYRAGSLELVFVAEGAEWLIRAGRNG